MLLPCYFVRDAISLPCMSLVVEFVTPEFRIVNANRSSFRSLVILKSHLQLLLEELQVQPLQYLRCKDVLLLRLAY